MVICFGSWKDSSLPLWFGACDLVCSWIVKHVAMPADKENKEVRDPVALELFKSIGLDAKTAANAVANPKVTANLTDVVHEVCFSSRRLPF